MLDRFADYWDKDRIHIDRITYVPIPDSTVRLANLRAGALDLIERMLADRHPVGARRPQAEAAAAEPEPDRLHRPHHQSRQHRPGEEPARAERQGAPGARAHHRPRCHQQGRVQWRVHAGQSVVGADQPVLHPEIPDPAAQRREGEGADQGSRRHDADHARPDGAEPARREAGGGGAAGDGGRGRLRPEDPPDRVRDVTATKP